MKTKKIKKLYFAGNKTIDEYHNYLNSKNIEKKLSKSDIDFLNVFEDILKNHFFTQEKIVFDSFFNKPQTMKEVEVITGIDRANICRYINNYRKLNKVAVLKVVYCSITKHRAFQLTTNPELFPIDPQLKLF